MSHKFLVSLFAGIYLAASAMLAPATAQKPGDPRTNAATTVNTTKSNTYKITAVNAQAGTFTATGKGGKEFAFIAPKGKPLPAVGKIYDITYTDSPGGGALEAVTVNGSKSNSSE